MHVCHDAKYILILLLFLLRFLKAVNPEVNLVAMVSDFLASTSIKVNKVNHSHN